MDHCHQTLVIVGQPSVFLHVTQTHRVFLCHVKLLSPHHLSQIPIFNNQQVIYTMLECIYKFTYIELCTLLVRGSLFEQFRIYHTYYLSACLAIQCITNEVEKIFNDFSLTYNDILQCLITFAPLCGFQTVERSRNEEINRGFQTMHWALL